MQEDLQSRAAQFFDELESGEDSGLAHLNRLALFDAFEAAGLTEPADQARWLGVSQARLRAILRYWQRVAPA